MYDIVGAVNSVSTVFCVTVSVISTGLSMYSVSSSHRKHRECNLTTVCETQIAKHSHPLSSHPLELKSWKINQILCSSGGWLCAGRCRRELMKAQLYESELEMRSSLTSGVFCVGTNLPAGQQTHSKARRGISKCYRTQLIRGDSVRAKLKHTTLFRMGIFQHEIINQIICPERAWNTVMYIPSLSPPPLLLLKDPISSLLCWFPLHVFEAVPSQRQNAAD